ncbi:MAG: glycosyltransferase family 4 protein [Thermodesulfobacteriota bacterium]
MKVLVAHNYYREPGGEDVVFAAETELLRSHGHEVIEYTEHNSRINKMNPLSVITNTFWSRKSKSKLFEIINSEKPDIAHFHNTFSLISPSAYYACNMAGIPVVQSLHNSRLICPAATFYREDNVCEDCLGKTFAHPSVKYGCYRNSRAQTAIVAGMLAFHRLINTWKNKVDTYIVFTEFFKDKFVQNGIPSEKIAVKPHFIDPDPGLRDDISGNYAFFAGRFDKAKGIMTLLEAWKYNREIPLKVAGDGELLSEVKSFIKENDLKSVELLGYLSRKELINVMRGARFFIWPSECYETFGLVLTEAFACGVPVIASKNGLMIEQEDGNSGLHFAVGDSKDLADKVKWAWDNPEKMIKMGKNARREYESKFTPEINYSMLLKIYKQAIEQQIKH